MKEPQRPVLLVEDDTELREAVAEALEDAGYAVLVAANGREGLDLVRGEHPPAVVLLDLLMPVMNGWEFCEAMRASPETARVPIVVMSGAVSRDPQSPYFMGVDDFLAKPINMPDLLAKLETYCRPPRAGEAEAAQR
ncbi:MAG: response regulator [Pseudomonadota bacterium]